MIYKPLQENNVEAEGSFFLTFSNVHPFAAISPLHYLSKAFQCEIAPEQFGFRLYNKSFIYPPFIPTTVLSSTFFSSLSLSFLRLMK